MHILMLSADAQMIDRRILQEARTLHNAGYQVTVLSGFECELPDAYDDDGIAIKRYRYDWIDRRRSTFYVRWGASAAARAGWMLYRAANRLLDGPTAFDDFVLRKALEHRFDVVHVHDFPMLRVGVMAARARGVPVIYDSHEFYPVQSEFPADLQRRYLRLERRFARQCAAVITVNPYLARMIGEAHGIPTPEVILNASELAEAEPVPLRERLGFGPDDVLILYQGWISSNRNIAVLIEAMRHLPERMKLVMVGYGDYVEVLKETARRYGLESRVAFLGRIESDDLPGYTVACDIGVIPYAAVDEMHRYCSPNKLFEFIMAGIPIVANDLPYLRDVVLGHHLGETVDMASPEDLAAAIGRLVASPEKLSEVRAAVRKARDQYNWTIEGRKLLDIYRRVLPLPPGHGTAAPTADSQVREKEAL